MATFGSVEYFVQTGTVAATAAFNTAVETKVNEGYALAGPAQTDGTNLWQLMFKGAAASFVAQFTINLATVGAAGLGSLRVAGDVAIHFPAGLRITVVGSTGNDGIYSVKNGGATFAAGNTTIPVDQAVASAVADGLILQYA